MNEFTGPINISQNTITFANFKQLLYLSKKDIILLLYYYQDIISKHKISWVTGPGCRKEKKLFLS